MAVDENEARAAGMLPAADCSPEMRARRRYEELYAQEERGFVRDVRLYGYHAAEGDSWRVEWIDQCAPTKAEAERHEIFK